MCLLGKESTFTPVHGSLSSVLTVLDTQTSELALLSCARHNGIYVVSNSDDSLHRPNATSFPKPNSWFQAPRYTAGAPARFLTRQGRVIGPAI